MSNAFTQARFTQFANVVLVDRFPERMLVTREFLEGAHESYVRHFWRRFTIEVTNGSATYRIVARHPEYPRCYVCEKVSQ